jgi:hypothetical protein
LTTDPHGIGDDSVSHPLVRVPARARAGVRGFGERGGSPLLESCRGTPTGAVTFDDGKTALATVPQTGGTASYSTATLSVGTHSITAVYNGDPDFTTSTSSVLKETIQSGASSLFVASEDVVVLTVEPASSSGSIPVASGSAGGSPAAPDAVSLALEALSDVAGDAELIRDVAEHGMSSKGARPGLFRLG